MLITALGTALLVQPLFAMAPALPGAAAVLSPVKTASAADAPATAQLTVVDQEMVTSGAQRIDYLWASTRGGKPVQANVHVIKVDLTNPYVKLNAMNGTPGVVTDRSSVMNMAQNSGAVAGVNADFFQTSSSDGSPMGAEITDGKLLTSPMQLSGMYMFGVTNDKTAVIDRYTFNGQVTAQDGAAFPLAGINQSSYTPESEGGTKSSMQSHVNAMYMYTSAWTDASRPADASYATPTEVLVRSGVVEQISEGAALPMTPPADGYILRTHGKAAQFIREHVAVGQTLQASYALQSATSGQSVDPASFAMMVGGHTILVSDGQPSSFSRSTASISGSTPRSRTAVGYAKEGKTVYVVTTEDSGTSGGMTLPELQKALVSLGVWKAVNLDGGGSTTMVDRPLGETSLVLSHPTDFGTTQRLVTNGLGVYSTAPKGDIKGIKASGSGTLFIGQPVTYTLKAYDTYYNPLDASGLTPSWSADKPLGSFSGNTFVPVKGGSANITVKSGTASDTMAVNVIGADQIAQMSISSNAAELSAGAEIFPVVTVTLKDGQKYTLPYESVKWEFNGFTAARSGDKLIIGSVNPGAEAGYAIARYDGYSALLTLTQGSSSTPVETFENPSSAITFASTAGVNGSVSVASGLDTNASQALNLTYDFNSGTTDTRAAYAVFDGGGSIAGTPTSISMDVYGDNSLNWVRAELTDAAGSKHLITLAKQVDWSGWKNVTADIEDPGKAIVFPVKLSRLYVASLKEGFDERSPQGSIAFDNISVQLPAAVEAPVTETIVMRLGSRKALVGARTLPLDTAPYMKDGTTYLPLRFVSDSIGGSIMFENASKRVSVLRAGKLVEMTIGSKDVINNGTRLEAQRAPIVQGGRTLVPIRLVAEQLGLKVTWDQTTKKITIQ
ncbi:copper amine oxidase [Paenibacillus beijingensis]|uniref:Copper amine oxidase n=1 Tax=Paenibacillus beijingensis TaxID=1126833 RepID=A0A0D5NQW6_9BACL|nr:copper amine oxidase [Paenibacillus beijingensis]